VWGVIGVGCDAATNETTLAAAVSVPKAIWACAGLHPEWTQLGGFDLEQVEAQIRARHSRLVALGEVGLPWYSLEHAPDAASRMVDGKARLERLLALASRYDLPVVLHAPTRRAMALDALRAGGSSARVVPLAQGPPLRVSRDRGY